MIQTKKMLVIFIKGKLSISVTLVNSVKIQAKNQHDSHLHVTWRYIWHCQHCHNCVRQ